MKNKPKCKAAFLAALGRHTGCVQHACKASGVSKATIYAWRHEDPAFAEAWEAVLDDVTEQAEQELFRRAVKGTLRPVYQGGAKVGTVREFSDTCLIFLLKALRPEKYVQVQRFAPTTPDGISPYHSMTADELKAIAAEMLAEDQPAAVVPVVWTTPAKVEPAKEPVPVQKGPVVKYYRYDAEGRMTPFPAEGIGKNRDVRLC